MKKPKQKDYHVRLDLPLAAKVEAEAKRENNNATRTIGKIVAVYFNPRRP